jgi:hypothetical protein
MDVKQLKTKTMYINVNFEVTEYNIKPAKNYEKVKFTIWEDSLIIEFCDFGENVLNQSEISIEDAKKLSKLLLTI